MLFQKFLSLTQEEKPEINIFAVATRYQFLKNYIN